MYQRAKRSSHGAKRQRHFFQPVKSERHVDQVPHSGVGGLTASQRSRRGRVSHGGVGPRCGSIPKTETEQLSVPRGSQTRRSDAR